MGSEVVSWIVGTYLAWPSKNTVVYSSCIFIFSQSVWPSIMWWEWWSLWTNGCQNVPWKFISDPWFTTVYINTSHRINMIYNSPHFPVNPTSFYKIPTFNYIFIILKKALWWYIRTVEYAEINRGFSAGLNQAEFHHLTFQPTVFRFLFLQPLLSYTTTLQWSPTMGVSLPPHLRLNINWLLPVRLQNRRQSASQCPSNRFCRRASSSSKQTLHLTWMIAEHSLTLPQSSYAAFSPPVSVYFLCFLPGYTACDARTEWEISLPTLAAAPP